MAAPALPLDLPMPDARLDPNTRLTGLINDHHTFVWRNLRRLGVPDAELDDAVQEVFLAANRRIAEIREGTEQAFLFRACLFVVKRVRRRFARRREVSDDTVDTVAPIDPRDDPEQRAAQSEARERLQRILDSMPDDYREVFVLLEMEQLTLAEVVSTLGLPAGTVSSRIFRARRFFERAVQKGKR